MDQGLESLFSTTGFFAQMLAEINSKSEVGNSKQYQNIKFECSKLFRKFVI